MLYPGFTVLPPPLVLIFSFLLLIVIEISIFPPLSAILTVSVPAPVSGFLVAIAAFLVDDTTATSVLRLARTGFQQYVEAQIIPL